MSGWVDTTHCQSRVHCQACRTDPAWRQKVGAPDICPWGVNADAIPEPAPPSEDERRYTVRSGMCFLCTDDCTMKHYTRCEQRARLRRAAFHCPQHNF